MKHFQSYDEFLNENYYKRYSMDDYYDALRSNHKRSSYVEDWIQSVKDILSGKVKELPRNHFKVNRGSQYGYEWVDSLVEHGELIAAKKGRKVFFMSPDSKEGKSIDLDKKIAEMIEGIENRAYQYGNSNDIIFKYDEKKEEYIFTISDFVMTWFHHEKGYGDTQSSSEIKENEKEIETQLEGFHVVKTAMEYFKNIFGSAKFKITERKNDGESRMRDGHKGYIYKVVGKVTK